MKNGKGVTLIALVTSIIIMFIIAGVASYSGIEAYKNMRVQNFIAKMKVIQEKVDFVCDNYKDWEKYGIDENNDGIPDYNINDYIKDIFKSSIKVVDSNIENYAELESIITEIDTHFETSWTDSDKVITNYFYFTSNDLEAQLGLKNFDMDVIINFATRNVISEKGIETIEGEKRYRQYDLPGGQKLNTGKNPELVGNIQPKVIENYGLTKKVQLTLDDNGELITSTVREVYYGTSQDNSINSIENWHDATKLSEYIYDEINKNVSFILDTSGKYFFKIVDSTNKTYYTENILDITLVNPPKLTDGMTPVKWDGESWVVCTEIDPEWYNYTDTSITGQDKKSCWANIMLQDGLEVEESNKVKKAGSMFVWIPRYEYKIEYTNLSDKSKGGTVNLKFLYQMSSTSTDKLVAQGYKIHPAFTGGAANNYANGEWDSEISGFWIAKFAAGFQANTIDTSGGSTNSSDTVKYSDLNYTSYNSSYTANALNQNLTNSGYSTQKISYPVFKPQTYAYNLISIGNAYSISKEMVKSNFYGLNANQIDSHMTKNSEFGAVAYLTHSKYGINKGEPYINNLNLNNKNSRTIFAVTGFAGAGQNISSTTSISTVYSYSTATGILASSTGNIYGIYDLNGCVQESVSGYILNNSSSLSNFGQGLSYDTNNNSVITASTKYSTIYPYNSLSSSSTNNWTYFNTNYGSSRYGDSILEISTAGSGSTSWNSDYSNFPNADNSFFFRGGAYFDTKYAGVFSFSSNGVEGKPESHTGFRAVLVSI